MRQPLFAALLGLAACSGTGAPQTASFPTRAESAAPGLVSPLAEAGAVTRDALGRCHGRTVTPAVVETATEQVVVRPAQLDTDGSVLAPATYRSVTRQRIVEERRAQAFEAVCPEDLTPERTAALQRALIARGAMAGPVTGRIDAPTAAALRVYQAERGGPDSAVLARVTAVALGLVPARLEELEAPTGE